MFQLKRSKVFTVIFIFLISTAALFADESFEFHSDSSIIEMQQGKKQIILTGNASIISETLIITADEIRRFGTDFKYTLCIGNVTAIDTEREIKIDCEELFFDTEKDIIRIESFSELYDKKNEVVTRSGFLLDKRKEKITTLSINVRIFKDDLVCRSEFAVIDHESDIMILTGHPLIYQEGNELSASKIIYNIDTGEIEMQGNVSGTIEVEEKKDNNTEDNNTEDNNTENNNKENVENNE